jgi:hypothetical protein
VKYCLLFVGRPRAKIWLEPNLPKVKYCLLSVGRPRAQIWLAPKWVKDASGQMKIKTESLKSFSKRDETTKRRLALFRVDSWF